MPQTYPKGETRLLKTELANNWAIFNQKTEAEIYDIVKVICKEKYADDNELFDMPVGIQELYDPAYLSEHSLLLTNSWQDYLISFRRKEKEIEKELDYCGYFVLVSSEKMTAEEALTKYRHRDTSEKQFLIEKASWAETVGECIQMRLWKASS